MFSTFRKIVDAKLHLLFETYKYKDNNLLSKEK